MNAGEFFGKICCPASRRIRGGPGPLGSAPGFRTKKAIFGFVACVLFGALTLAAQNQQIFKGEVCLAPSGPGAVLEKGQPPALCVVARPKGRDRYILFDLEHKTAYQLDDRKKAAALLGSNADVVGILDHATATIHVYHMFRALPPKVMRAKSVYIDCDACPRGMAAAWLAAFQELTDWGVFDIVPDPKKADLVFLLSANPYLGDYVTRDGPDQRPVSVDITHMNVVDPATGESLWDDSRRWGSVLVSRATKDLIVKFREQLEFDADPAERRLIMHKHRISGTSLDPD